MLLRSVKPTELPRSLPRWPSYRQVRRFCRQVVKAIGAEPPLAAEELGAQIGKLRRRPITIEYRDLPAGVFGFSLPAPGGRRDLVFVAANTTRLHQDHVLLHELGHILAGHLDGGSSTAVAHTRDDDETEQREWVAESIATVLAERALLHQRRFGDRPLDPSSRALDEALRSGRTWI